MDVDLVGIEAVSDFIRHSKLNYYYIHKYPSQQGTLAIYEYRNGSNAGDAATDFIQWASIMNKGSKNYTEYQITILNFKEGDEEKDDPKRIRRHKIRASFVFYKEAETEQAPQYKNNYINGNDFNQSPVNFQAQLDEKINALRTELTLKHENEKLLERIESLEDELDEVGEAAKEPDYLTTIMSLIAGKNATTQKNEIPKAVLNGPPSTDKWDALKETIRTLLEYDPELPTHLGKLAHLAKTNTAKFHVLINMLDTQL